MDLLAEPGRRGDSDLEADQIWHFSEYLLDDVEELPRSHIVVRANQKLRGVGEWKTQTEAGSG